jgi:hypothetical protein
VASLLSPPDRLTDEARVIPDAMSAQKLLDEVLGALW